MATRPYKLRCTLTGHSMDVRAVTSAVYPEGTIVTGSRDRTTRIWSPNEHEKGFSESHCMVGPTDFVSSVCTLPPSDQHPCGLVLVGSNDCAIYCFSLDSSQPIYKLHGHSGTVCALASGKFGTVVSGSWDKTARVWLGQKCVMVLEGHQAAVWAVQILPEQGLMLTGSADKAVRMWRAGKCERIFEGHEDCVRGLAVLSTMEFLSCSNDTTIRHWQTTGHCLRVFSGHTSFVYSIAVLPDSTDFVTCGEDRTIRVWNTSECVQTICLPAQSVWSVSCLMNGDIVVGASDGTARVFTRHPELQASPDELAEFEKEVSKVALPAGEIGNMKINELPGLEALYEPGKRDGQTKLIRDGSSVSAHQWNASEGRWMKIGDVVGSNETGEPTGGKVHYEGKEYDYVFSVDIEDGKPPLKLPYNITEDPWFAAQKFIHKHNLSQLYLDQIANFIMNNSKGMSLGEPRADYVDPFTGGSRYIPGGNSMNASSDDSDSKPGPGKYRPPFPQSSSPPISPTDSSGEPLSEPSSPIASGNTFFPQTVILRFDNSNEEGIKNKLKEFNIKVPTGQQLSEDDFNEVLKLLDTTSEPSNQQVASLEKIIHWPKDMVFPALDLLRLAVRNSQVNSKLCELGGTQLVGHLLNFITEGSVPANQMLSLRTLCNLFTHPCGANLVMNRRERILAEVTNCKIGANKNAQIALATLFLNYAVLLHQQHNIDAKLKCLTRVASVLHNLADGEACFRLLVCLGTLIWGDPEAIAHAKAAGILPVLEKLKDVDEPEKLRHCAQYLALALH